ncbi:hypothetical protein NIES2135_67780 (plasmid) [Leptolyngbya boryana NIES-2135]|uniref:Transposase n=1 Tax=Leptolyngbya boryana NIES-2135 TaxID=1973484 RepID=A0A1Z4JT29_LEPBY|nr:MULTISPECIES: hypothetical protein [Leptolyngbya]BAY59901.1 hypothetical protein NIES2135_67780 [Leptolyngbya boryana NIES-2135]MBD2369547.1 hypothetical protein [Leptolyngbya sp. FACHB-161]MBD2376008.1 hypothetical protein [Leptolyngbya sp. FACHB-238]MBD2400284.1 hypothetical protein [Leptolyngbya sp. FACHB-239]MBD2406826.1 hypothetical protein [Leptolyngbya sp. FACHB-402]
MNQLQLQSYKLNLEHRKVQVFIDPIQQTVHCPVCDQVTNRVHNHYE